MKHSARLATLVVLLLLAVTALAMATPPASRLDFHYLGTELPARNRESLEVALRNELRPAHPVRMLVTITDREIGTR
ncbi:MAG: hypothetical protein JWN02_693 [Acidobacteria bacterium]|nr:hypothetical protein [Acidobacteriota bacterium]